MKLLILDRAGIINEPRDTIIGTPDDCVPIPGSSEAIARLCHAGYRIVIAAFRTGLESGTVDLDTLNRIHDKLQICGVAAGGHLDALFFSPTSTSAVSEHERRMELFREIADRLNIDLTTVTTIGASAGVVRSARAAGASAVLLRTGLANTVPVPECESVELFDNLSSFTDAFLSLNGMGA